jgi:hypothetical protein
MKCSVCKDNDLQTRRVFLDYNGPMCRPRYSTEEFCFYCEWNGTAGLGKQLRDVIQLHNKEL